MTTTKKHISFPSIDQFRNVISNINRRVSYMGVDELGEAIYDNTQLKPTLKFKGTVKLHGTNAGVAYNNEYGFWAMSRENIITATKEIHKLVHYVDGTILQVREDLYVETGKEISSISTIETSDNAGFAFFAEKNKQVLTEMLKNIAKENDIDLDIFTISMYGEWAGPGIQKGVGISMIPQKSLFIFGVKVSDPINPKWGAKWLKFDTYKDESNFIYNINDFPTFEILIDFNMPQMVQNKLIELTLAVETECPVSRQMGIPNALGEGIVFETEYKDEIYRFKSKGEKHSISKTKTLNPVDIEKLNSIKEFIDYSVTENRFEQALEKTFGDNPADIKKMGDLIRWMVNDIIKEELDTMVENNLEPKEINKYISTKTREFFIKHLDSITFNK